MLQRNTLVLLQILVSTNNKQYKIRGRFIRPLFVLYSFIGSIVWKPKCEAQAEYNGVVRQLVGRRTELKKDKSKLVF